DPVANYDRVRRKYSDWGSDPDPQPIATRTVDSAPQTAVVSPNAMANDPVLQPPVDSAPANPAITPR
ncbi:MAG TPA: hypothetical protein VNR91_12200, partial [Sphingomonas sp.]|nr:hypothetical protein [Sphingomonas sp.]